MECVKRRRLFRRFSLRTDALATAIHPRVQDAPKRARKGQGLTVRVVGSRTSAHLAWLCGDLQRWSLLIRLDVLAYRPLFRKGLMCKLLKTKWSGRVDSNHRPPGPESGVPGYLLEYRVKYFRVKLQFTYQKYTRGWAVGWVVFDVPGNAWHDVRRLTPTAGTVVEEASG